MLEGWRDRLGAGDTGLARVRDVGAVWLSDARTQRRLQQGTLALTALWCAFSLAGIAWSLLPQRGLPLPALADIINPVERSAARASAPSLRVDIERLVGWHLFGDPGSASAQALSRLEAQRQAAAGAPAGVEDTARDTRLPLVLRGAVSSAEDTAGYAMIEHQGKQAVYAVGDQLPVPGQVRLAKVLSSRVIIDNAGSYEQLRLFEDSPLFRQAGGGDTLGTRERIPSAAMTAEPRAVGNATLAAQYRDRLYSDPQSLADVVQVAPVRRDGNLLGYRLSPGRAAEDFAALGFQPGDIVTAVNGLSLSDPANALRLYQAMRDERAAVFELQRDGSERVLSVQLPENGRP